MSFSNLVQITMQLMKLSLFSAMFVHGVRVQLQHHFQSGFVCIMNLLRYFWRNTMSSRWWLAYKDFGEKDLGGRFLMNQSVPALLLQGLKWGSACVHQFNSLSWDPMS